MMTTLQETPEYKAYVSYRDSFSSEKVYGLSELAEAAMVVAYNLGQTHTKAETPNNKGFSGFKCPDCDGYKFGTMDCSVPVEEWIRECHGGDYYGGCGFEWPVGDDAKYGLDE